MIRAVIFDMYETLITHYHGKTPLYFSPQIAKEAGVPLERFQEIWRGKERERTVGELSLEETLLLIVKDENKVRQMAEKRTATAEVCFQNLHPEVLPMLEGLKEQNIKTGLISNCFSEEADVIRRSILAPYFDEICLSYELGMRKPEQGIYEACVKTLKVQPQECLYVGDGGSSELEAAQDFGMTAVQACWYLLQREDWPAKRKEEFRQVLKPMNILDIINIGR